MTERSDRGIETGGQERSDRGIETSLQIPDPDQRRDLAVFAERVLRLDDAAVIRLRARADGLLGAWAATGFDVLVVRAVAARVPSADRTCGADALLRGLRAPQPGGLVDLGFPMDSAWRATLPPETGFVQVDDVPAAVFADLARQGADLARTHGSAHGPPASLLDQQVLEVSAGDLTVGIPMRCVLAWAAMGFSGAADGEVVRVRATPVWLRLDARYGSVYRRRAQNPEFTIASAAISR